MLYRIGIHVYSLCVCARARVIIIMIIGTVIYTIDYSAVLNYLNFFIFPKNVVLTFFMYIFLCHGIIG
jgi:hypothetical protein